MDSNIDFDQLAQAAFPEVNRLGPVQALDRLWRTLFSLDKWYFLAQQSLLSSEPVPYRWDRKQNGEYWFLAFTDQQRAIRFASDQQLGNEVGQVPFVSLDPQTAREHIANAAAASSIFGVRFNEGSPYGWAAPAADIQAIYEHVSQNGDRSN